MARNRQRDVMDQGSDRYWSPSGRAPTHIASNVIRR